jgi:hypothetical protein
MYSKIAFANSIRVFQRCRLTCCTLPLWIAGGLTLTGSAVALDICKVSWLPTLLIAGAVAAVTILLTPSLRRRRHQRCATADAAQGCDCSPPDSVVPARRS